MYEKCKWMISTGDFHNLDKYLGNIKKKVEDEAYNCNSSADCLHPNTYK